MEIDATKIEANVLAELKYYVEKKIHDTRQRKERATQGSTMRAVLAIRLKAYQQQLKALEAQPVTG